jgi:hypothetical protein
LDRLANMIEYFIREKMRSQEATNEEPELTTCKGGSKESPSSPREASTTTGGPLYYRAIDIPTDLASEFQEDMQSAIPLIEVLASNSNLLQEPGFSRLRKFKSMPAGTSVSPAIPLIDLPMRRNDSADGVSIICTPDRSGSSVDVRSNSSYDRRRLVNRPGSSTLEPFDPVSHHSYATEPSFDEQSQLDYMTITDDQYTGTARSIPLIPFDEIMLIEALGTGRVSTIYRAAWRRMERVQMVALKVAMLNHITGDASHVDELRREADIAARLQHPNICDLVGVAADEECFCLAYDFCEGGSLLSLLTDSRRYYEYLPIALDVANGMAYLHSRSLIHRDLKPSNILITRDHRAKVSDFGMSVANTGQELTAETGTYR